jgi:hypothetical protein
MGQRSAALAYRRPVARGHSQRSRRRRDLVTLNQHHMEKDMRMQRIGAPIAPEFLFNMLPLCFFHQKYLLKVIPAAHPEHYLALDDVSLYHRLLRSSTQAHQPQCADSNGWTWSVRRQRRSCLRDVIDITYIARLPP